MERRFESRREEVLADCQVPPAVFNGMMERLVGFAAPYVERLCRPEQREHAQTYLQGLLSDLQRKNAEAIAYRHDKERQGLQTFIGTAPWDHQPLRDELARQVGRELGEPAGVPREERRFRTRHELALEMLQSKGSLLPHAWVAGDDEMGRPAWFRRELADRGERYLLAVPSNTTIRDLEAESPAYRGHGRRPKVPFQQLGKWCESLPASAWTKLEVRDGAKGPIKVEIVRRRVLAKIDRKVGPEETLVVIRSLDEEKKVKTDYHLSDASPETPLAELARAANAEHRIEECIKRGKSEAGLARYQVRNSLGWHHPITLCLIAVWFLLCEARRGNKMDPGDHRATSSPTVRPDPARRLRLRHARSDSPRMRAVAGTQRACQPRSSQRT